MTVSSQIHEVHGYNLRGCSTINSLVLHLKCLWAETKMLTTNPSTATANVSGVMGFAAVTVVLVCGFVLVSFDFNLNELPCTTGFLACCCPCIQFGKNKNRLDSLNTRGQVDGASCCSGSCCLHALLSMIGCSWILQVHRSPLVPNRTYWSGHIIDVTPWWYSFEISHWGWWMRWLLYCILVSTMRPYSGKPGNWTGGANSHRTLLRVLLRYECTIYLLYTNMPLATWPLTKITLENMTLCTYETIEKNGREFCFFSEWFCVTL